MRRAERERRDAFAVVVRVLLGIVLALLAWQLGWTTVAAIGSFALGIAIVTDVRPLARLVAKTPGT